MSEHQVFGQRDGAVQVQHRKATEAAEQDGPQHLPTTNAIP
jgi:hypothetical protein